MKNIIAGVIILAGFILCLVARSITTVPQQTDSEKQNSTVYSRWFSIGMVTILFGLMLFLSEPEG